MKRIVVMEVYEDATTEVQVYYVEDHLYDPMSTVLNSMNILYESQVVERILPEDGNAWLPVGWSELRKEGEL